MFLKRLNRLNKLGLTGLGFRGGAAAVSAATASFDGGGLAAASAVDSATIADIVSGAGDYAIIVRLSTRGAEGGSYAATVAGQAVDLQELAAQVTHQDTTFTRLFAITVRAAGAGDLVVTHDGGTGGTDLRDMFSIYAQSIALDGYALAPIRLSSTSGNNPTAIMRSTPGGTLLIAAGTQQISATGSELAFSGDFSDATTISRRSGGSGGELLVGFRTWGSTGDVTTTVTSTRTTEGIITLALEDTTVVSAPVASAVTHYVGEDTPDTGGTIHIPNSGGIPQSITLSGDQAANWRLSADGLGIRRAAGGTLAAGTLTATLTNAAGSSAAVVTISPVVASEDVRTVGSASEFRAAMSRTGRVYGDRVLVAQTRRALRVPEFAAAALPTGTAPVAPSALSAADPWSGYDLDAQPYITITSADPAARGRFATLQFDMADGNHGGIRITGVDFYDDVPGRPVSSIGTTTENDPEDFLFFDGAPVAPWAVDDCYFYHNASRTGVTNYGPEPGGLGGETVDNWLMWRTGVRQGAGQAVGCVVQDVTMYQVGWGVRGDIADVIGCSISRFSHDAMQTGAVEPATRAWNFFQQPLDYRRYKTREVLSPPGVDPYLDQFHADFIQFGAPGTNSIYTINIIGNVAQGVGPEGFFFKFNSANTGSALYRGVANLQICSHPNGMTWGGFRSGTLLANNTMVNDLWRGTQSASFNPTLGVASISTTTIVENLLDKANATMPTARNQIIPGIVENDQEGTDAAHADWFDAPSRAFQGRTKSQIVADYRLRDAKRSATRPQVGAVTDYVDFAARKTRLPVDASPDDITLSGATDSGLVQITGIGLDAWNGGMYGAAVSVDAGTLTLYDTNGTTVLDTAAAGVALLAQDDQYVQITRDAGTTPVNLRYGSKTAAWGEPAADATTEFIAGASWQIGTSTQSVSAAVTGLEASEGDIVLLYIFNSEGVNGETIFNNTMTLGGVADTPPVSGAAVTGFNVGGETGLLAIAAFAAPSGGYSDPTLVASTTSIASGASNWFVVGWTVIPAATAASYDLSGLTVLGIDDLTPLSVSATLTEGAFVAAVATSFGGQRPTSIAISGGDLTSIDSVETLGLSTRFALATASAATAGAATLTAAVVGPGTRNGMVAVEIPAV